MKQKLLSYFGTRKLSKKGNFIVQCHFAIIASTFQLIQLFTCQSFIPYLKVRTELSELAELTNLFGKAPVHFFPNCDDALKRQFTTTQRNSTDIDNQIKEIIRTKIGEPVNADKVLIDFFSKMIHLDPLERRTAKELLKHNWLKESIF